MIAAGDRAPNVTFALGERSVSLDESCAQGPLVLFFYPRDETPGCTAEACSFRDAFAQFSEYGAHIIGISGDGTDSHTAFASKFRLPYPLASDPDGAVRKAFGVPRAFGILPGRVTYVIDRDRTVRTVFNAMFAPQKHVLAALAAVAQLAAAPAHDTRAAIDVHAGSNGEQT